MEGPHNIIADVFSRLSHNDESSPLGGNKAAYVISNSESDNDNESLYSSIMDNKEILNCLLSLPCIYSNRKQKKRHANTEKYTRENRRPMALIKISIVAIIRYVITTLIQVGNIIIKITVRISTHGYL